MRESASISRFVRGAAAVPALFLWAAALLQLHPDWEANPQYGYGWFVPLLAVFLLWKRWLDRPIPELPGFPRAVMTVLLLMAVAYLPLRLVQEANADWRFVSWALAMLAAAWSLGRIYLAGGAAWTRHFGFPLLFLLTAVPWPHEMEHALVQSLMRAVASITVEGLDLAGIPAMQRGNLIELSAGTIGVDEACSGVRSLQSTLMASLFLGETYRLRAGWRISLVGAGLFLAFVFNVLRAFLLAWIGARQGIGALGRWHDQAGYSILLLCAISLWLIVTRLKHAHGEPETVTSAAPGVALGVNRWFPCVSLAILITAEVANVSWYRSRERQLADNPRWSARWPQDKAVEDVPITANTRLILGYDEGRAGSWRDEADRKWIMFFLRWEPGAPGSRMVARVHRPENCLPATGLQLVAEHGLKEHQAHGLPLPFRGYEFSFEGQPWHVFYCLWEDKSSAVALQRLQGFVPATGRLKAVWEGRRRQVGQQTLEVIITGCRSFEEATRAFAEALPSFVAPNPHPKK